MFSKRPCQFDGGEDGASGSARESKRFKNDIREVLGEISMDDCAAKFMEPFFRRVVKDAVEEAVQRLFHSSSRPSFNHTRKSGDSGYLLHFVNRFPSTIFTNSRIEAEDGISIRIELLDAITKEVVRFGPLSSAKIEIVALDGEFCSDDQEDWDESKFTSSVAREREGRRPLVSGEINVTLRDGVGQIGDVSFTDNSSWQRSQKFRLGARVVSGPKNSEVRIREAISEAFRVKDHRGELYKKHYPPRLVDEVWRLEKIAKDGAFHKRLASNGIRNVKDFLQQYAIDSSTLRERIGCGISNRIWDAIISHATTCVPDDGKFYSYYEAGQGVGLLFNSVYKLVGATWDGQNYKRLDDLNPPRRGLVENLVRQAYKNVNDFILIDELAIFGPSRPLTSPPVEPFHGPNLGQPQLEFSVPHLDQPEMQLDFGNASCSTSYGCTPESSGHFTVSFPENSHPMPSLPQVLRNSFKLEDVFYPSYTGENSWSASSSQLPVSTGAQFLTEDTWTPMNSMWSTPGNAFFFASDSGRDIGIISSLPGSQVLISRIGKSKARWCKIRAAVRWHSVRRLVASKRLCQIF